MSTKSVAGRWAQLVLVPVLVAAVGVGVAQGQDRGHDNNDHGHDNNRQNQGNNFHFRDQDRGNFQSHYTKDINRWRNNPRRPHFTSGQRVPRGYRFQPVPRSYYANVPPPPPGYQYGYSDGYVVAYNPTTQIIADVMDLVAGAANSR